MVSQKDYEKREKVGIIKAEEVEDLGRGDGEGDVQSCQGDPRQVRRQISRFWITTNPARSLRSLQTFKLWTQ